MESKQKAYIGDISQLISVRTARLCGGRAEGTLMTQINNGCGLDVTVLPDRGMDLYQIRFDGHTMNYLSPAGIVSPAFYNDVGAGFLRNFFAGFLTTCGLTNIGGPNQYKGTDYPMHGRLSNTPAQDYLAAVEQKGDTPTAVLQGTMLDAAMFYENLSLTRRIEIPYGENVIRMTDTIRNRAFTKVPYALLYHFNTGYPFLCEDTEVSIDTKQVVAREAEFAAETERWNTIAAPHDTGEIVLFHRPAVDENGRSEYTLTNRKLGIGFTLNYDGVELDRLTQWKMFNRGEYTMGLEPCNSTLGARAAAHEAGAVKFLEGQQEKTLTFEIRFFRV